METEPSKKPDTAAASASSEELQPNESVTEFQGRMRALYASRGGFFDFGDWLAKAGPSLTTQMSHVSWAPYRSALSTQKKRPEEESDS